MKIVYAKIGKSIEKTTEDASRKSEMLSLGWKTFRYENVNDPPEGEAFRVDTSYLETQEEIVERLLYVPVVPPTPSVDDYDIALEDYCREVREARGYTTNLPTDYYNSTVPRWAQDAIDYGRFRDEVLLYGLEVENRHAAGEPVPTLDEFKAHLRTIECHWTYQVTED